MTTDPHRLANAEEPTLNPEVKRRLLPAGVFALCVVVAPLVGRPGDAIVERCRLAGPTMTPPSSRALLAADLGWA